MLQFKFLQNASEHFAAGGQTYSCFSLFLWSTEKKMWKTQNAVAVAAAATVGFCACSLVSNWIFCLLALLSVSTAFEQYSHAPFSLCLF